MNEGKSNTEDGGALQLHAGNQAVLWVMVHDLLVFGFRGLHNTIRSAAFGVDFQG